MEIILAQRITVSVILAIFFVGRYSWSFIKGKRTKFAVSEKIINGRFWISLIIYFLLPLGLILNLFGIHEVTKIFYNPLYIYTLGCLVSVAGLILMFLARFYRQSDWGFMGDDSGQKLFTKGIYSIIRHPYYIGAILVGIGVYAILNSWLIILLTPVIIFIIKVIKTEDLFLFNKFGQEWVDYRNKVRF